MKNQILLVPCILLLFGGCKKKKEGIEALPEATQIGKNTFGCLVNGQPFTPKAFSLPASLSTSYQFIDGKYFFSLSNVRVDGKKTQTFLIKANDMELEEKTYVLTRYSYDKSISGIYSTYIGNILSDYETSPLLQGELRITKVDQVKRIIAGTFSFDAENEDGQRVEVREGRFDSTY